MAGLIALVGSYGSGKTELAVNLALQLARDRHVQLADLDLVNPYFRCREARALLESRGIRVVVPPGAQAWADLPIVLPEIRGLLHPPSGVTSLFDVGGDDVGARALASMRTSIDDGQYELWQVINARRPFTNTVQGCLDMRRAIEAASRWRVTGIAVNTHLMDDTTAGTILDGWALATAVRDASGLPIRLVGVMSRLADAEELRSIDAPVLRLERHMLPPWRQPQGPLPAARPVPLGRRYGTAPVPPISPGVLHGSHRD